MENKLKTFRDLNLNIPATNSNSYTAINETKQKFNKTKNQQYNCLKEKIGRIQAEKSKDNLRENREKSTDNISAQGNNNCNAGIINPSLAIKDEQIELDNRHIVIENKENSNKVFSNTHKNISGGIINSSVADKLIKNQPTIKERIKIQLLESGNKSKGNSYQTMHKILKK